MCKETGGSYRGGATLSRIDRRMAYLSLIPMVTEALLLLIIVCVCGVWFYPLHSLPNVWTPPPISNRSLQFYICHIISANNYNNNIDAKFLKVVEVKEQPIYLLHPVSNTFYIFTKYP